MRLRRTRAARDAAIKAARKDAAASLAQAQEDHASEQAAVGHDVRLAEALRQIRRENHFAATIAAAFRGEDGT
jgi:hypothetical protein